MDIDKFIEKVENEISKGKIDKAINSCSSFYTKNNFNSLKRRIIILKSRLSKLKNDESLGILSNDEYNRERNKIANSVLDTTSEIQNKEIEETENIEKRYKRWLILRNLLIVLGIFSVIYFVLSLYVEYDEPFWVPWLVSPFFSIFLTLIILKILNNFNISIKNKIRISFLISVPILGLLNAHKLYMAHSPFPLFEDKITVVLFPIEKLTDCSNQSTNIDKIILNQIEDKLEQESKDIIIKKSPIGNIPNSYEDARSEMIMRNSILGIWGNLSEDCNTGESKLKLKYSGFRESPIIPESKFEVDFININELQMLEFHELTNITRIILSSKSYSLKDLNSSLEFYKKIDSKCNEKIIEAKVTLGISFIEHQKDIINSNLVVNSQTEFIFNIAEELLGSINKHKECGYIATEEMVYFVDILFPTVIDNVELAE